FDQRRTTAAVHLGQNVGAKQYQGARFRFRQRRPESARVAANQIQLQFAKLGWFNVNVREFAETRVDAIDGAAFGDDILDDSARLFDPHARRSSKRHTFFAARDRKDLCKRKSLAVKFEHKKKGVRD